MADPNKSGFIGFEDASKAVAFIIFSNNLFVAADSSNTGKLTLEQMKGQLPWLGITNLQPGQAEGLFQKFDADKSYATTTTNRKSSKVSLGFLCSNTLEFSEFVALALALRFPNLAALL